MRFPSLSFLKNPWWEDRHYRKLGQKSASKILRDADVRNNPLMWGVESLLRDTREKALKEVSPLQSISYNIGELDSRERTARKLSPAAATHIQAQRRILEHVLNARSLRGDKKESEPETSPVVPSPESIRSQYPWLFDDNALPRRSRMNVGTPIGGMRYLTIQAFEDVLGTRGKSSLSKAYLGSAKA